jgi:citrate synthase
MNEWVARAEALERLGVRAQTLYAYVSRGMIGMQPDPQDSRRSLYSVPDLDRLTARRRRGRKADAIAASAMAWGEPSIPTRISTIELGRLLYRGEDAVELSKNCSLEQVAALLWEERQPIALTNVASDHFAGGSLVALAGLAGSTMASLGRSPASLSADGAAAISCLAQSFGLGASTAPLHQQLAKAWAIDEEGADLIRQALVLMADHDLNASTFAVRVAASTGAAIPACLLAGLATLSGPRHGGATAATALLMQQAEQIGPLGAIQHWLSSGQSLPGFGHPLYPQGDVRAGALMPQMPLDPLMAKLAEVAHATTHQLPNIDFALVSMMRIYGLPSDAPFQMFALGRSIGWVAHAIEQITCGTLIRPRGRYIG